jgi:hypothetical protein
MRFMLLLFISAFGFAFLPADSARADTAAAKPPEVRTIQPLQLSPPLSAAQLAKQATKLPTPAAVYTPEPVAGTKPAPVFTALGPNPRLAGAHAEASAAKLNGGQVLQFPLSFASIGSLTATPAAKPVDLVTATQADPAQAGANAAALANKLAHASPRKATSSGRKPASTHTDGPVPATLSPAQLAKRAQVAPETRRPQ